MIRLSVNVNKVATLRNSRGGRVPRVLDAVRRLRGRGRAGITVHPRADRRHITPDDVRDDRAQRCAAVGRGSNTTSKAIRGPTCSTLVAGGAAGSVHAGAGRAGRGHEPGRLDGRARRRAAAGSRRASCKARGIRVSLFVDPEPTSAIRWAASVGADRVELYTEPFARAFERGRDAAAARRSRAYARRGASWRTRSGLGVNAGHDLDLDNLDAVPHAAAPGRGVDRPRDHLAGAVRRASIASSASTSTCSRGAR